MFAPCAIFLLPTEFFRAPSELLSPGRTGGFLLGSRTLLRNFPFSGSKTLDSPDLDPNLTSVGNAILVDQRRFVDDAIRSDVTAGFDCRGCREVRNEYSDQRGRQSRTAHGSLPSTNELNGD